MPPSIISTIANAA
jgi:serine/threonine-protein phosphatase 2A regulatory subunit B